MLQLTIRCLIAAAVVSMLSDREATPSVLTGTVTDWQPGRSIAIVNEQTDPGGVRFALRDTNYHGDRAAIRPGAHVTVSYEVIAEREPLATEVRVHDARRPPDLRPVERDNQPPRPR